MLGVRCDFNYEYSVNERIFFGKTLLKVPNSTLILIVSKIFLREMLIYCNVNNSQKAKKIYIHNELITSIK